PGLPLVEVAVRPDGGLRLTQRRFLARGTSAAPLSWRIPVGLKVAAGGKVQTLSVLLAAGSQDVDVPGGGHVDWVMPNLAAAGYYRWAVPDAMLPAMAHAA